MSPPIEGIDVSFEVTGANFGAGSGIVDSLGSVEWCYTAAALGADTITATTCFAGTSHTASAQLVRTLLTAVPVYLQHYESLWTEDHVEVTRRLLDGSADLTFSLYRKEATRGSYLRVPNPGIACTDNDFSFKDRSALRQNLPNPFSPSTEIEFSLDGDGWVGLSLYGVSGKFVRTLIGRPLTADEYKETWDGRDMNGNRVASAVYFYRLKVDKNSQPKSCTVAPAAIRCTIDGRGNDDRRDLSQRRSGP